MQYADPFAVECEKCGFIAQYPLNHVLMFSAECQKCGFQMRACAQVMHVNLKSHNASLWPVHFVFEGLEVFGLDIDEVTDEEFYSINTLWDFCNYVENKLGNGIENRLFNIPMLKGLVMQYDLKGLLKMELVMLGNIACGIG